MKSAMIRRAVALLLAVLFSVTPIYAAQQPQATAEPSATTQTTSQEIITRGQFARLVNDTFAMQETTDINFPDVPADHPYAADLLTAKAAGYLSGDDKGFANPDAPLSGAAAVVILNNLLGFDPAKAAVNTGLTLADWAKPDASVLIDLGITTAETAAKPALTVSDAEALLTALSVAQLFPDSPYALTQEDLKDDYYAYTNRRYLATATIPPGNVFDMSFSNPQMIVDTRLAEIFDGILAADAWAVGGDDWKIKELYQMYMDQAGRAASIAQLRPYLDEIDAVQSIPALNALAKKYAKVFSLQPFYTLGLASDAKVNAKNWAVFVAPSALDLGSKDYYADDEATLPVQEAYRGYIRDLLRYLGETEDLDARVAALYAIEKGRAEKSLAPETANNPEILYTKATWDEMLALTKTTGTLTANNEMVQIVKDMNIYCPNKAYIAYIESLYTEENLSALKDMARLSLVSTFAGVLGDEIITLNDDLELALLGTVPEEAPLARRAQTLVSSMMEKELSQMYTERYCTPAMKQDVTKIVEDIRGKYRERIAGLTWMSAATKEQAIEKLDAIKAYVAYPDEPPETIVFDVKARADGGTLIDAQMNALNATYQHAIEMIQKPFNYNLWDALPVYMVNAFYMASDNAIVIPAGILMAPFYDPNDPREAHLGGLGAIVAHEISHAFDNNGALYDKDGTLRNWWTAEDFAAFNSLTDKTAAALSKINFVGDTPVNGVLCTGETVADLSAMQCVLDILDDDPAADLSKAMEAWSKIWAARMSAETAAYLLAVDTHAPNKVRTNFILAQLDVFYAIYGVTESDDMYIPEEERIAIW